MRTEEASIKIGLGFFIHITRKKERRRKTIFYLIIDKHMMMNYRDIYNNVVYISRYAYLHNYKGISHNNDLSK